MSGLLPPAKFPSSFFSRNGSYKECEGWPKLRSLQLDTVMPRRQRQSLPRLLQLPVELLDRIIDLLQDDKKALASLALVDSVCRYLARACQFKEIHFDYSPQSHELLRHMATESLDDKNKTKLSFPIGFFVRKLTFAPLTDFFATIHPELFNTLFTDRIDKNPPPLPPQEIIDELLIKAQEHYVNQRKLIFTAIVSKMPNLVGLVWKDKVQLDSDFIEAISRCSAERVKLEEIQISKNWPMRPPLIPVKWNLCSLDLNIGLMTSAYSSGVDAVLGNPPTMAMDHPTSVFLNTLFQCCSSTLESLTWWHMGRLHDQLRATLDHSRLTFPRLKRFRLKHLYFEPKSFSLFMSSSLRHLEIPGEALHLVPESLKTCEREEHMKTLAVNIYEDAIPNSSLAALNTFVSLEQLTLRVGCSTRLESNWQINHDTLRNQLKDLKQLKKLFLLHDTYYRPERKDVLPAQYYNKRIAIKSDLRNAQIWSYFDTDEDYSLESGETTGDGADEDYELEDADEVFIFQVDEVTEGDRDFEYFDGGNGSIWAVTLRGMSMWEKGHRNRMLAQAEAYAKVFQKLEWIYCGQWPMGFRPRHGEDGVVREEAYPLSAERDECRVFYKELFGIDE